MSRKFVAVVLGATLMFGVVGVGAAPAGAQEGRFIPKEVYFSLKAAVELLVTQIDQVCSDASYLGETGTDRLNTVCAQLPSLKLVVEQTDVACVDRYQNYYLCSPGQLYGDR